MCRRRRHRQGNFAANCVRGAPSDECAICRKILSKGIPKGEIDALGAAVRGCCPLCSVSSFSTRCMYYSTPAQKSQRKTRRTPRCKSCTKTGRCGAGALTRAPNLHIIYKYSLTMHKNNIILGDIPAGHCGMQRTHDKEGIHNEKASFCDAGRRPGAQRDGLRQHRLFREHRRLRTRCRERFLRSGRDQRSRRGGHPPGPRPPG